MLSPHIALGRDGKVSFWGSYVRPIEGGVSIHFTDGQIRGEYIDGILTTSQGVYEVDKLWEGEVPHEVLWKPAINFLPNYKNAIEWIENEISKASPATNQ